MRRMTSVAAGSLAAIFSLASTASTALALGRAGHVAILDPPNKAVYVFGGRDASQRVTNDTYILDYAGQHPAWRRLPITGAPPPRETPVGAFIPARRQLLIAGGMAPLDGTLFSVGAGGWKGLTDVWILHLDPTPRWEELRPQGPGPSARTTMAGAYDPKGDRLIVFGGRDVASNEVLDDLWELSFSPQPTWRKLEPGGTRPPANLGHEVLYDMRHDQMVLFGGTAGGYKIWRLDLKGELAWRECDVKNEHRGATNRTFFGAAFDSVGNGASIFGGTDVRLSFPELWGLQIGVANETPGQYIPICSAHKLMNPDPNNAEASVALRPAPEPRAYNAVVTIPHPFWIEKGNEQLVTLVIGGRKMASESASWSLLGPVLDDVWGLYEINPPGGGSWLREWRRLPVAGPPTLLSYAQQRWDSTGYNNSPFALADVARLDTRGGQATFYVYSNEFGTETSHARQANVVFVRMPSGAFFEAPLGGVNTEVQRARYRGKAALRFESFDSHQGSVNSEKTTVFADSAGLRFTSVIHDDEATPRERTTTGRLKLTTLPPDVLSDPDAEQLVDNPEMLLSRDDATATVSAFLGSRSTSGGKWVLKALSFERGPADATERRALGEAWLIPAGGKTPTAKNQIAVSFQHQGVEWKMVHLVRYRTAMDLITGTALTRETADVTVTRRTPSTVK